MKCLKNTIAVVLLFASLPLILACSDTNAITVGDSEDGDRDADISIFETTDHNEDLSDAASDTATDAAIDSVSDAGEDSTLDSAQDSIDDASQDTAVDTIDWGEVEQTEIVLSCSGIAVTGPGVVVNGGVATITNAGSYRVSGVLCDGQLRVDTADAEDVKVTFAGVNITCSTSAAFYVLAAEEVDLILEAGSQNYLTDGSSYVFEVAGADEPNAALFSKADLKIKGEGSLTVKGNYNDGIASKDSLKIKNGVINVTAKDDGLRGKDDVTIEGGDITINSTGDGIASDNAEDASKGYISISDGTFNITASGDGLAAQTAVQISGGAFALNTGGGSTKTLSGTMSAKAIKGTGSVSISGGTFTIDSADDGVHSNGDITISGGRFNISVTVGIGSGDQNQGGQDGMHSDATLQIDGGEITIAKSYEGLEAMTIIINDGLIYITATDDGVNCAGGDGSSGWQPGGGTSGNYFLYIRGGYLWMNAGGDGLDSNGNIEISGGVVLVNGPTSNNNGAMDSGDGRDNYIKITGGFLVAVGSSGMAEAPGTSSTQNSALIYLTSSQQAGKMFHLQNSAGADILTFVPLKAYQSVVFSSPDFKTGQYSIYLGGGSSGVNTDGLYANGAYTPGTLYSSFTVSSVTTKVGSGGRP